MHWRDVIFCFLEAGLEDARSSKRANSRENQVVESSGSERLKRWNTDFFDKHQQRLLLPLDSPESYTVLEESDDVVIARVDECANGYPMQESRFRLVRPDESWLLDDVFWNAIVKTGNVCFVKVGTVEFAKPGIAITVSERGPVAICSFFGNVVRFVKDQANARFAAGKRSAAIAKDLQNANHVPPV